MKTTQQIFRPHHMIKAKYFWQLNFFMLIILFTVIKLPTAYAATALADQPVFSSTSVPGNVLLDLSVEFPTALSSAYTTNNYSTSNTYLGYFDDKKCYQYNSVILYNTGVDDNNNLLAAGTTDPHWVTAATPGLDSLYGNGPMNVVQDNLFLGSFVNPTTVNAKPIGQSNPSPATFYYYETKFTLPANINPANVVISFTLGHDDGLVWVSVNRGIVTGYNNPNFSAGDNIVINSTNAPALHTGVNTLEIGIFNQTGQSGINIYNMKVTVAGNVLGNTDGDYFVPVATTTNHTCSGLWSGNLLNWVLTQTIDPFRSALTGGYRVIDTPSKTVLQKAWDSGQSGYSAQKTLYGNALVSGGTPYNWGSINFARGYLGTQFVFSNSTANLSVVNLSNINQMPNPYPSVVPSTDTTGTGIYAMYASVQACVPGLLESNCTLYPYGNYKPTGLMQNNAMTLRFGAIGYLNDSNIYRDGGVLRARMASLGPFVPVPNANPATNPNPEWDPNTGIFYTNPVPADATATGVTNSGVINYLNKFGLTAPGYKTYDPVSELYYTATRYYRNIGNVASYSSNLNSTMIDGFPVITTWDDPIKYSCQKNFIVGIGDTNTHADANLPGSTIRSGYEPAIPPEVTLDATNGTNVTTSTNYIGQLEGLGNLGTSYIPWCCSDGNTFFMAGLAYDVHTRDIRSDFTGTQTISTYWLDVLEGGAEKTGYGGNSNMRNQFWLTAKYGGFTVPANYVPYASATPLTSGQWYTLGHTSTDTGTPDPDNYFVANNPASMISGLTSAFRSIIAGSLATSSALALPTPNVQSSGNTSYSSTYDPSNSTGSLIANALSFDTSNNASLTQVWNARDLLETQAAASGSITGWDTQRFIATSSPTNATTTGVPFRIANITSTQQSALGSTTVDQQNTLNFLRGDRSNAGTKGTQAYRDRVYLLGDIVDSKLTIVGAPASGLADSFNPGYSSFATTYVNRKTVVYVGANDGMMHAFDGTTGNTTSGKELFAYIPSVLFNGPSSPSTPTVDGLKALSNPYYSHHFYVDATPREFDVDFNNAAGLTSAATDWHSLLVGGLGKGGKAYYALDVTNPASLNTEANLAAAVKWEFTDARLGFSYGVPIIAKTKRYGWVVILTSGYNNADGKGYFFILNPKTGALLQAIQAYDQTSCTAAGVTDSGLAAATGFLPDGTDFTLDAVYAGDLCGNLWRLDLTSTSTTSNYPTPTLMAQFRSSLNAVQPVTVAPTIAVDSNTSKRYVFVGTGRILASSDLNSSAEQTFYAIIDGTRTQFFTSSTLPSVSGVPLNFPITRSNLNNNTTGTTGIVVNANTPLGWYIDLGFDTGSTSTANSVAYRYNIPAAVSNGTIAFATNSGLTSSASLDASSCNPSGTSQVYALSFATGGSILLNSTGASVKFLTYAGTATDIQFVSVNGTTTVQVGFNNGSTQNAPITPSSALGLQQLNWRELPSPD